MSTINDSATPQLNWIYVDRDTYEVKHGLRVDAQQHITGPFDCTRQDRRMTVEGWEGFVAVEETPGVWALYFDRDDNGLAGKVLFGTRVLEVELTRREKKERKPKGAEAEARTLDEMMAQHKESERRKAEEEKRFAEVAAGQAEGPVEETEKSEAPAAAASTANTHIEEDWSHLKVGNGDDVASTGSKTAVPSLWGDDALTVESGTYKQTDDGYRQPYVEEVAQT